MLRKRNHSRVQDWTTNKRRAGKLAQPYSSFPGPLTHLVVFIYRNNVPKSQGPKQPESP